MTRTFQVSARAVAIVAATVVCVGAATLHAQDWASWRGPENDGMTRGDAPITWDEAADVAWKVPIPGRGHSSPVVWGDQIFLTTAVQLDSLNTPNPGVPDRRPGQVRRGSGGHPGGLPTGRAAGGVHPGGGQISHSGGRSPHGDSGAQVAHRFVLLSLDKTTGAVVWERTATEATPHEGFSPAVRQLCLSLASDRR